MSGLGLFPRRLSEVVRGAFRVHTGIGIEFPGPVRIFYGLSPESERVFEFDPERPPILFDSILSESIWCGVTIMLIK